MVRAILVNFFALTFLFLQGSQALSAYPYKIEKQLEMPAKGLSHFSVIAGAGKMNITCVKNAESIRVHAVIHLKKKVSSQEELEKIVELSLKRKENEATLVSMFRNNRLAIFPSKNQRGSIDLNITLPASLSLSIKDGSGPITMASCAGGFMLTDGSGDIEISNIKGNGSIRDGSGDIFLKNMKGRLSIVDGSGGIVIQNLEGDLDITDGSGGIKIAHIKGDVKITDGSGDCSVTDVKGVVHIRDGSGDIRISDVTKDVFLHSTGSGGVQLKNIKGRVIR